MEDYPGLNWEKMLPMFSLHLIVMRNPWYYCHCLNLSNFDNGDHLAYAFPFLRCKQFFFVVPENIKIGDYWSTSTTIEVKMLLRMNKQRQRNPEN